MQWKHTLGLSLLAFGLQESAFSLDCDAVLISSGSGLSIENRSSEVQQCIDLASDIARGVYLATFNVCEKQGRGEAIAQEIVLPDGRRTPAPQPEETWEQYALRIGDQEGLSGCRDGIRSALIQRGYFTEERIRKQFAETELFLSDVFNGSFQVSADTFFGSIQVPFQVLDSTFTGYFTEVGSISSDSRSITFTRVPFEASGTLKAEVRVPGLGGLNIDTAYYPAGFMTGRLNLEDLTIEIQDSTLTRFDLADSGLTDAGIQILSRNVNQAGFRSELSLYLTDALKRSYNEVDPFTFLRPGNQ
ncbi:MAG: hypothetical protein ACOVS5_01295 [Oligoflexus sp.]|jgi:hypothetical protein